jgi:hypothetical protein
METKIQSKSSEEKRDWYSNHVLTKEQLAQLIQNKFQRAKVYHTAMFRLK